MCTDLGDEVEKCVANSQTTLKTAGSASNQHQNAALDNTLEGVHPPSSSKQPSLEPMGKLPGLHLLAGQNKPMAVSQQSVTIQKGTSKTA